MNGQKTILYPFKTRTWIVLSLLLSGVIYLNLMPYPPFQIMSIYAADSDLYGWPICYASENTHALVPERVTHSIYFVMNVVVNVLALYLIGLVVNHLSWRHFRFRLTTVILLTLAAGALLGLKLLSEKMVHEQNYYLLYGWPYTGYLYAEEHYRPIEKIVLWKNVAKDVTIAFLILGTVAFLFEWYFRSRDKNAATKLK